LGKFAKEKDKKLAWPWRRDRGTFLKELGQVKRSGSAEKLKRGINFRGGEGNPSVAGDENWE